MPTSVSGSAALRWAGLLINGDIAPCRSVLAHATLARMDVATPARIVRPLASGAAPWAMLLFRPVLALALQAAVALGLLLFASACAWRAAAGWGLAWFAGASVINLLVLRAPLRREGVPLRVFYLGRTVR